jgi:MFS superfamily sulfate permease-like transporter
VCILAGVLRLGFITELLSKPIRYGYMNGIALTVLIGQLPKLLGVSIERPGPLRDVVSIGRAVIERELGVPRPSWSGGSRSPRSSS